MIKKDVTYTQIAVVYIGAVVGAGFASGQEILQFFCVYGYRGFLGIIIAAILFILFGYIILFMGKKLCAESYNDIIQFSCGKKIGRAIDIIITIFLFCGLAAMIAGSGAIFEEYFRISYMIGTLFMAIVTLVTVFFGIKGVLKSLSIVVPYLLISILAISIYIIIKDPITISELKIAEGKNGLWIVSSLNYVSYNLVIAFAILTPLGAGAKSKKDIILGAFWGGIGLGVILLFLCGALLTSIKTARFYEIPMVYMAHNISLLVELIYSIVLFLGIYSTAVGNLYSFVMRISKSRKHNQLIIIVSASGALLLSQLGFSNMVKYFYPFIGYAGIIFFVCLINTWIKNK